MTSESVTSGFLLVDKPGGWTSHDVVAKVRNLVGIKKVGHAGTLDPMATGLIVLGLGRATRLLRFVQEAPKEYLARAVLGVATDTLDADGAILERAPAGCSEADLRRTMQRFVGTIAQVAPMISARKVGGRRLYELAREGKEVERAARDVRIYELDLIDFAPGDYPEVEFRTVCGTGTYVRTLADDIATTLGSRAHLTSLRRLRNGSLHVDQASSIEDVVQASATGDVVRLILPAAAGLPDLPAARVPVDLEKAVSNGIAFPVGALADPTRDGAVRLLDERGKLLAVYRITNGRAVPEVVMA